MRQLWVVVVVAGCSFPHGESNNTRDARVDDASPDGPDAPLGIWTTPTVIAELDSGYGEDDPSLTSDLLEIYFGSFRPGGWGFEDIWMASRTSTSLPWGTPVNVTPLNTSSSETTMRIAPDGLAIFFTSDRGGNQDIYFAERDSRISPWTNPVRVLELSTANGDYAASVSADMRRIVMCSGASVSAEALYVSVRANTSANWGNLVRVTELDEAGFSECDPVEPHGRAIYYASNRAGRYDIYMAQRSSAADPYGARMEVPNVNVSNSHDRDVWVSADERYMVLESDRSGTQKLYLSTR